MVQLVRQTRNKAGLADLPHKGKKEVNVIDDEPKKGRRGGAQPGAGRPRITDDSLRKIRPGHVVKAWPEEYEVIKRFVKHVRADRERCRIMLDFMDAVTKRPIK